MAGGTFGKSLRRAAPRHVVQHQLDLGGAERLRFAHRPAGLLRRRGKAIQMAVGRLALVPPAALRREDGSGGKHVGHVRTASRRGRQRLGDRHVLGHEPDRRHAPAEHRSEVLIGLRVHVGIDQPGDDPLPRGVHDFRSGRQEPHRIRRRDAHGDDPSLGHHEQGVPKRRRSRPVDERGPADGDRGGEQNGPAHSRKTGPTWSRARALSRAPLPRSRPDRCP